ncbi:response regulator [Streptomyces lusitanus]|uniref:Response regulator transcription factor n=1 Tax=Streptomyces lusitanus TaxID=68232 RepID=A0ABU3JK77_9ACTN|nr:response regulator transcription factor [Streptomyces lusitanus]
MIRVLLADDQTVVRAGFRALLDLTDDLVTVAEAADGAQAVELTRTTRPDVVLMDIRMPRADGLAATRRIVADPALDAVRVLVLTTYEADEYVFESLRAGAAGFLLKDIDPDDLRAAIRTVAAGQSLLAPAVTRRVIEEFTRLKTPEAGAARRLDPLTAREREVLALVGRGLSNEEIGARLLMSPLTAKTHVSRVMTKMSARDRAQLVVLAYETGLVRPGEN